MRADRDKNKDTEECFVLLCLTVCPVNPVKLTSAVLYGARCCLHGTFQFQSWHYWAEQTVSLTVNVVN